MRQAQRPTPQVGRPAPGTTVTQLLLRPAIQAWLDRVDPSTDPWPRAANPTRQ